MFSHGGVSDQIVTTAAYNDNNWHFAVDTFTNGTEELYVDGQFAGSQQVAEFGYNSAYAYIVGTGDTANWQNGNGSWLYFNGALDEINVSNTARSGDWIQTEYSNQSSPSTFYALYPENAEEAIPATVSLTVSQSQQFTILGSVAGSCKLSCSDLVHAIWLAWHAHPKRALHSTQHHRHAADGDDNRDHPGGLNAIYFSNDYPDASSDNERDTGQRNSHQRPDAAVYREREQYIQYGGELDG